MIVRVKRLFASKLHDTSSEAYHAMQLFSKAFLLFWYIKFDHLF